MSSSLEDLKERVQLLHKELEKKRKLLQRAEKHKKCEKSNSKTKEDVSCQPVPPSTPQDTKSVSSLPWSTLGDTEAVTHLDIPTSLPINKAVTSLHETAALSSSLTEVNDVSKHVDIASCSLATCCYILRSFYLLGFILDGHRQSLSILCVLDGGYTDSQYPRHHSLLWRKELASEKVIFIQLFSPINKSSSVGLLIVELFHGGTNLLLSLYTFYFSTENLSLVLLDVQTVPFCQHSSALSGPGTRNEPIFVFNEEVSSFVRLLVCPPNREKYTIVNVYDFTSGEFCLKLECSTPLNADKLTFHPNWYACLAFIPSSTSTDISVIGIHSNPRCREIAGQLWKPGSSPVPFKISFSDSQPFRDDHHQIQPSHALKPIQIICNRLSLLEASDQLTFLFTLHVSCLSTVVVAENQTSCCSYILLALGRYLHGSLTCAVLRYLQLPNIPSPSPALEHLLVINPASEFRQCLLHIGVEQSADDSSCIQLAIVSFSSVSKGDQCRLLQLLLPSKGALSILSIRHKELELSFNTIFISDSCSNTKRLLTNTLS